MKKEFEGTYKISQFQYFRKYLLSGFLMVVIFWLIYFMLDFEEGDLFGVLFITGGLFCMIFFILSVKKVGLHLNDKKIKLLGFVFNEKIVPLEKIIEVRVFANSQNLKAINIFYRRGKRYRSCSIDISGIKDSKKLLFGLRELKEAGRINLTETLTEKPGVNGKRRIVKRLDFEREE